MAKFLNTAQLIEWIPKIINKSKRELVILAPYVSLSKTIYNCLADAERRGVETIFVYREILNKTRSKSMQDHDREKLLSLDNLNLLHHPNLHSKCIYNERYLLITSINLHQYSELNNREMGILVEYSDTMVMSDDDREIVRQAKNEIIATVKSAHIEKESRETTDDEFYMEILKPDKDIAHQTLNLFNKHFKNKKFDFSSDHDFTQHDPSRFNYLCTNYFDKVDVFVSDRIEFYLNFDEEKLTKPYQTYKSKRKEMEKHFEGCKFYWNQINCMYLYEGSSLIGNAAEGLQTKKMRIDNVINFIKNIKEFK